MILAYLDSLFILYSFLHQPLPCNNILTISLRQKEQQQQESRKIKLDPKWELSILNLQNLIRPFLLVWSYKIHELMVRKERRTGSAVCRSDARIVRNPAAYVPDVPHMSQICHSLEFLRLYLHLIFLETCECSIILLKDINGRCQDREIQG